jgi:hypothetical protein
MKTIQMRWSPEPINNRLEGWTGTVCDLGIKLINGVWRLAFNQGTPRKRGAGPGKLLKLDQVSF